MEPILILGLVVLSLYVLIRLASSTAAKLSGSKFRAYRLLAQRYGGKYENRGLSDPPTVSFVHGGSSVRVGLAPNSSGQVLPPRTRVVARFGRGLPLRLELAPTARLAPAQPPKGTRLVRLGDPDFDRHYVVQANDADIAREFLSPTVRWAVENLRRLAPPAGMLVSVNPERLLVQVDRNLGAQADALAYAVHQAMDIHDCLQVSVAVRLAEGIKVVDVGPPSAEEGPPTCKVCGEAIEEVHVVCTTCRTPHHRDCWTFVGGCSIFGCNGKQCAPT